MTDHTTFVLGLTGIIVFLLGFAVGFQFFVYSLRWCSRSAHCGQFVELMRKLLTDHIKHKHHNNECSELYKL